MIYGMKKGSKLIRDNTGEKRFYITVISFSHIMKRRSYWNCLCECGKSIILSRKSINESKNFSCGCIAKQGSGPQKLRNFEECIDSKMNCIMNNCTWKKDCLIWNGALDPIGIPRISFLNLGYHLKDLLFFFKTRKSVGNHKVTMKCKNKLCINIEHMELESGRRNTSIDRLFKVSEDRRKQTTFEKSC